MALSSDRSRRTFAASIQAKGQPLLRFGPPKLSNLLPCVPKPLIEGVPQTAFEDTSDFEAGTRHQVDELSWTQFL